jgi:hypothetical protein
MYLLLKFGDDPGIISGVAFLNLTTALKWQKCDFQDGHL